MPMTHTKYLLIGGGVASVSAAKAIRELDTEGRVMLVTSDSLMPYDRPPLSKNFLANPGMTHDDVSSKYDVWYTDNRIEVTLGTRVDSLDRAINRANLESGELVSYEKLLLATGSRARTLGMTDFARRVFALRTIADAGAIRDAMADAESAVIVGTGYLGPEVAAECVSKGIKTTIIGREASIWDRFASPELGEFLNSYYRSKGVDLILNDKFASRTDSHVVTAGGVEVPADLVVLAVGAEPNTELARHSQLPLDPLDGGVIVDAYLQTTDPSIFAAGDIAHFPDKAMGKATRHEHHLNAQWQGAAAGANMAGAGKPYERVSYFFSDFLDLHMIQRGSCPAAPETKVIGNLGTGEFTELYADHEGVLKMGISISREEKKLDPLSDKLEALISNQTVLEKVSQTDFK